MKRTLIALAAAATALTALPTAASAQRWMNINERQQRLDRRIDQGVRSGELTRREAYRLRARFTELSRLENRYRRNGLSNWERADLNRRFDAFSRDIRWQKHDGQDRDFWR